MVSGRHVLKADANSRTAQFVTLWGRQGATGGRRSDWSPSTPGSAGRQRGGAGGGGVGGQPAARGSDPSASSATARPRSTRATRSPATGSRRSGRPGDRCDAGRHRRGRCPDQRRRHAAGRRDPGRDRSRNYQVESIFLFADETRMVTFPLTGARLREVLEHGVADGSLGKGGFLQVSGILFTYDRARPSGSRLVGDIHAGWAGADSRRRRHRAEAVMAPVLRPTACAGWRRLQHPAEADRKLQPRRARRPRAGRSPDSPPVGLAQAEEDCGSQRAGESVQAASSPG